LLIQKIAPTYEIRTIMNAPAPNKLPSIALIPLVLTSVFLSTAGTLLVATGAGLTPFSTTLVLPGTKV
jgi:hypothetical protein